MGLFNIMRRLRKIYSPSYLYTLDRSVIRTADGYWLFKEFGTHTFVKKTGGNSSRAIFSGTLTRKTSLLSPRLSLK